MCIRDSYKGVETGRENLIWTSAGDGYKRSSMQQGDITDSFDLWFYSEKDNVIRAAKEINPDVDLKTNEEVYEFAKNNRAELNKHLDYNLSLIHI